MCRTMLALVLMLTTAVLSAQEGPRVVKMEVSPAPKSASSIALWPHLRDLKPGNAAIFYERSQSIDWWGKTARTRVESLLETLEEPWVKDAGQEALLEASGPLKEIDYAARCETCDWQFLDRMRSGDLDLMLPDMQSMRTLFLLNDARIRAAVYRRDFEGAAHALQTNFVMSKHIGEAPMAIPCVIGTAMIAAWTHPRLEEWISQPDAPSLYWALADLPTPLIDSRRPFEGESILLDRFFPEIRKALGEGKPIPIATEVLRDRLNKCRSSLWWQIGTQDSSFELALSIAELAGPARDRFAKKGLTAGEIDRLPVTQLVLMYLTEIHDERTRAYVRLHNLPYWQARPYLAKIAADRIDGRTMPSRNGFTSLWLPALDRLEINRLRGERNLAILRVIEALRLHAADHGEWPDTLEELDPLPVPADPCTGKAFAYRRQGSKAIVEADAPPGEPSNEYNAVRYELTLRKNVSK
jgi:hypothetical protein